MVRHRYVSFKVSGLKGLELPINGSIVRRYGKRSYDPTDYDLKLRQENE